MAKTIAISDEAYEKLVKIKLPGESFSDVIIKTLKRAGLSDIAGSKTVTKKEWKRVVKAFQAQRELDERRRRRLMK